MHDDDDDNRIITVIPAAPGYMVVWVHDPPEEEEHPRANMCDPVLAWQVQTTTYNHYVKGVLEQRNTYSYASPITLEGSHDESPNWGIRRPDGCYEIPGIATYRTFAEFNAAQLGRKRAENS